MISSSSVQHAAKYVNTNNAFLLYIISSFFSLKSATQQHLTNICLHRFDLCSWSHTAAAFVSASLLLQQRRSNSFTLPAPAATISSNLTISAVICL